MRSSDLATVVLICQLVSTSFASDLVVTARSLPSLPDSPGVASPFAGICNNCLVVAGGANFPTLPPWKGGRKVWHDTIFRLTQQGWEEVGQLPRRIAYGVSIQTSRGILCLGGSDDTMHFSDVFLLSVSNAKQTSVDQVTVTRFPSLPLTLANACGALVGDQVIVAGGTTTPDDTQALAAVWVLNLSDPDSGWTSLPEIPGPGRILSVAASSEDSFFVFSGAALSKGSDGKAQRAYLKDAWQLNVASKKWTALPDMPAATVAAPTPAPVIDATQIVIFGGDDGTGVGFQPPEQHPGFRMQALVFDLKARQWTEGPRLPVSRVTVPLITVPLITDKDNYLLPSGEIRPGVRSPEVFQLQFRNAPSGPR